MPAATQTAVTPMTVNSARCQALFCSGLQPSDAPTADMVAAAISRAVQQFGIHGCASRMAQEFGDHPDTAARRMRWARQLIAGTRPQTAANPSPSPARKQAEPPMTGRRCAQLAQRLPTSPPGPRHPRKIGQTPTAAPLPPRNLVRPQRR